MPQDALPTSLALPMYAQRVSWGLYGCILTAALLAYWDRTGTPFLPLWLSLATMLSLVVLVLLIVLLAFLADRSYSDSVQSSGTGIKVLGGGLALTVLLLLPVLQVAEALRHVSQPSTYIPLLPFAFIVIVLLSLNLFALRQTLSPRTRTRFTLLLLIFPYIFFLALWLVWLGRTSWLYLRLGEDSTWLKTVCLSFNLAYALGIAYAGSRVSVLFSEPRSR